MNKMNHYSLLRQTRREAVSDTVLAAAEQVIARKGYDGATMQDIANASGCAAGTLYLYFKTKDELFNAMAAKHSQALSQRLSAAVKSSADPLKKLRSRYETFIHYMNEHPVYFRIFYTAAPTGRATLQASLRGTARRIYRRQRQAEVHILKQAQAARQIRHDLRVEELVEFLHGVSSTASARWSTSARAPSMREQLRLLWEVIRSILKVKEAR